MPAPLQKLSCDKHTKMCDFIATIVTSVCMWIVHYQHNVLQCINQLTIESVNSTQIFVTGTITV